MEKLRSLKSNVEEKVGKLKSSAEETAKGLKNEYPWTLRLGERLFSMVLNYTDLAMDVIVMLEYGCILNNELITSCDLDMTSIRNVRSKSTGTVTTCEPHPVWFGLSLTILLLSTCLSAGCYAFGTDNDGSFARCCLGLSQLSHLNDVWHALTTHAEADAELSSESVQMNARDLMTKLSECTPQLYLQSYVLFAVGAHGDGFKVLSTVVSAISLAHGIAKSLATDMKVGLVQRVVIGLFLTTDQLLRASAYAMVLSPAARPLGIVFMLTFAFLGFVLLPKSTGGLNALFEGLLFGVLGGQLVPFMTLGYRLRPAVFLDRPDLCDVPLERKKLWVYGMFPLRYLEMVLCGAIAWSIAETSCGYAPTHEVASFSALLVVNVLIFCVMICCMDFKAQEPEKADPSQGQNDTPTQLGSSSPSIQVEARRLTDTE